MRDFILLIIYSLAGLVATIAIIGQDLLNRDDALDMPLFDRTNPRPTSPGPSDAGDSSSSSRQSNPRGGGRTNSPERQRQDRPRLSSVLSSSGRNGPLRLPGLHPSYNRMNQGSFTSQSQSLPKSGWNRSPSTLRSQRQQQSSERSESPDQRGKLIGKTPASAMVAATGPAEIEAGKMGRRIQRAMLQLGEFKALTVEEQDGEVYGRAKVQAGGSALISSIGDGVAAHARTFVPGSGHVKIYGPNSDKHTPLNGGEEFQTEWNSTSPKYNLGAVIGVEGPGYATAIGDKHETTANTVKPGHHNFRWNFPN